jgi:hypothetical protein
MQNSSISCGLCCAAHLSFATVADVMILRTGAKLLSAILVVRERPSGNLARVVRFSACLHAPSEPTSIEPWRTGDHGPAAPYSKLRSRSAR